MTEPTEAAPAPPAPDAPTTDTSAGPGAVTTEPAEAAPAAPTTDITAGPGGVMTDEVGVITGDLTVRTEFADGKVTVGVQYKDAEEWYVVTGGRAELTDPAAVATVHAIVVGILNRPDG